MDLEDLLLKKEELPIRRETDFIVPIYPSLLREDIQLDPQIAHRVFPQAIQEYLVDLAKYTETAGGEKKEYYLQILRKDRTITTDKIGVQRFQGWEDFVRKTETGFAKVLATHPGFGGSLYYNPDFQDCRESYIFPPIVQFPSEKFEAYSVRKITQQGTIAHTYGQHNIDYFPEALFLRNWAILYLNEALREVERQGKL